VIEYLISILVQIKNYISSGPPKGYPALKLRFAWLHDGLYVISLLFAKWHQLCAAAQRCRRSPGGENFIASNRQIIVNLPSLHASSLQRGFTLIELLVVMVVMGVALGLVVVQ